MKVSNNGIVIGILSVALYVVCVLWLWVLGSPELREFHMMLVRVSYPGFALTVGGLLIGLVEAFIYGWLLGAGYAWLRGKIK